MVSVLATVERVGSWSMVDLGRLHVAWGRWKLSVQFPVAGVSVEWWPGRKSLHFAAGVGMPNRE